MNNKKFVFVLGAGASKVFGYPTGDELIQKILGYKNDSGFLNVMDNYGISKEDIRIFTHVLKDSGLNSIDAFLTIAIGNKRPQPIDFERVGRACITYAILAAEKESKLNEAVFSFEDNWCRHIFAFLDKNYLALIDGRVRFLTFNYDLSLEYFIATSYLMRNYLYSISREEVEQAVEFLNKIKFLHLYGCVGSFIEFDDQGRSYGTFFDTPKNLNQFLSISEKIEIVRPEELPDTHESFKLAKAYLSEADYIFFLGFGFDRLNMERLGLHEVFQTNIDQRKFYITAYHADNSSIYDFENRAFLGHDKVRVNYTIGKKEEKIVSFLKDNCFELSQLED